MAVLTKKVKKTKAAKPLAEAGTPRTSSKREYLTDVMQGFQAELKRATKDGSIDLTKLGEIGKKYAFMSADTPEGRAVVGYKRVFKVATGIDTVENSVKGRD